MLSQRQDIELALQKLKVLWFVGKKNLVDDAISQFFLKKKQVSHPSCAEAAVVTVPDEVTGQAIIAFCTLRHGYQESEDLVNDLKQEVKKHISGIARPDEIIFSSSLPKTRSGKIMRRSKKKMVQ